MLINGEIDEENAVYKYNRILLSLKKESILKQATTQTNFEDTMLSEINQSQKTY